MSIFYMIIGIFSREYNVSVALGKNIDHSARLKLRNQKQSSLIFKFNLER
jgi:hypothetical protein